MSKPKRVTEAFWKKYISPLFQLQTASVKFAAHTVRSISGSERWQRVTDSEGKEKPGFLPHPEADLSVGTVAAAQRGEVTCKISSMRLKARSSVPGAGSVTLASLKEQTSTSVPVQFPFNETITSCFFFALRSSLWPLFLLLTQETGGFIGQLHLAMSHALC